MADEIVKIIKIESDGAEQTVASLVNEIKSLTEAMNGVQKGTEEYTNILKDLIDNQDKLSKAMKTSKQETTAAEGSYNALVKQMAALKKQWRETTDEASRKELGNQIKDINTKLKDMDASIGNFQRNVGNYADGVKGAFGQMGGAAKGMVGPLNSVKAGFTALSAHPLVAVLTALAALLVNGIAKGFKSSEENTNKLRVAFSGFQAIGDAVTKMFQTLAGWIGKVAEATINFADKLGLLGPKFKQRQEMMKKQIELEKQERDLIVKTAQLETDAAELRAKASDEENYTIAQRIQFLQEAQAKEQEQLELEKAILEQKVAQLEAQLALTDSTGEELTKLNELKAQVIQVNAKIAQSQRSTNKEITALRRRGLSEAQQANQARLNLEKDLIKQEYDLAAKGGDERLRLAKELRKKELDIQLEGLKQKIKNRSEYSKAEKLAIMAYDNDIAKIELQHKEDERQNQQVLWDIRLLGLREGSSEYFKEYANIVKEKTEQLAKDFKPLAQLVDRKIFDGMDPEQARKLADASGKSYNEYLLMLTQYTKEYEKALDDATKATEQEVELRNKIALEGTEPMLDYYHKQHYQLRKMYEEYDTTYKLMGETDEQYQDRKKALLKRANDALNSLYNEDRRRMEELNEYGRLVQYERTGDIRDFFLTAERESAEAMRTIEYNMESFNGQLKDYINQNLKDMAHNIGWPEEVLKEAVNGTKEQFEDLREYLLRVQMIPEDLLEVYKSTLRRKAEETKKTLDTMKADIKSFVSDVQRLINSISDIYAISLENKKKNLEKEGKYTEKERAELEKRYKTVQAMQIAEAVINTIAGALGAFMGITKDTGGWGIAAAAAEAAAVTAAGVAQIMKIKQTNPYSDNSSSLSSGGGGAMSATVTPTVSDYNPEYTTNLTGRSDTDYLNEALGRQKLFVSVVDINDAQERGRVRVAESSF